MEGQDVEVVQGYLRRFGYFPNPALAAADASWRPVIASAPERLGRFDATTEAAVRAYQQHSGLAENGVVDAPTRALLVQPRCGAPERASSGDGREKLAFSGNRWTLDRITWQLVTSPSIPGVLNNRAREATSRAAGRFNSVTKLSVVPAAAGETANIVISVANLGSCVGAGVTIAQAQFPNGVDSQRTLQLNQNCTFWVQNTEADRLPATSFDLESILVHELGHNLGLNHSTLTGTAMYPSSRPGATKRGLAEDDQVAIGNLYNEWRQIDGCANDLAGAANGNVWIIDCDLQVGAGGGRIWRFDGGNGWIADAAVGRAMFIALTSLGVPWVVNSFGGIFRRTSSSPGVGAWERLPGCAVDIGIGADEGVWVIGCDDVPGGHSIFKFNGADWDKTNDSGGAVSIAVDSRGRPWVVNSFGDVFRRSSNTPSFGTWDILPRVTSRGARDIGILKANPENTDYAWVVTADTDRGSRNVFLWESQDAQTVDGVAPDNRRWFNDQQFLGGSDSPAGRVSVTQRQGRSIPWVRNGFGDIFTKQR